MNTRKEEESIETLSGRPLLLHEISQRLVQTREAKGEMLSKPANKLKIPINHMQAFESGNWDDMPDDVYVIGFLRQYSAYLGLDLSDEIDRLKNSKYTLTRPLTFPDPPVAPSRQWAWLTGGAFVLLFVLFNVINIDSDDKDIAPTTTLATDSPERIISEKTTTEKTTPEQVVSKSAVATQPVPKQAIVPKSPLQDTKVETKPKKAVSSNTVQSLMQPAPTKQQSTPPMHTFRFEAVTAAVWIQIFSPNQAGDDKGRLVKEMLLKKGQFSNIRRATESFWITCGNARALRIKVDRKIVVDTGQLGSGKKILRDYHFNINDYR